MKAIFHLPGLFEFYEFYKAFLTVFYENRNWFYHWAQIGSIYGSPGDCIWAGGRIENGQAEADEVLDLLSKYAISARLTFSNSLLRENDLTDKRCNDLCALFEKSGQESGIENGIIVHSDLLCHYIRTTYPGLYLVSSTTKVLTDFSDLENELKREEFRYVVPDFRLNKTYVEYDSLEQIYKDKLELLCNECCWFQCQDRKECYEAVSRKNLGIETNEHICIAPESESGYRFSRAMKNPAFISRDMIQNTYLPMGLSNFKIEGRSLGSALILEFLLYYLTKPEYQLNVREEIYLDNSLDLF